MSNHKVEQDAASVLSWLIVHYHDFIGYPRSKGNLCEWVNLDEHSVINASLYLCKNGFARMRGIHIEADIDGDGMRWLLGLRDNPHFQISAELWKDEVLTGMTSGGKETKIVNPVVQTCGRVSDAKSPDDKIIKIIKAARAAVEIESIDEDKEVRVCKGFGRDSHTFHSDKRLRKRGYCNECRFRYQNQSSSQSE